MENDSTIIGHVLVVTVWQSYLLALGHIMPCVELCDVMFAKFYIVICYDFSSLFRASFHLVQLQVKEHLCQDFHPRIQPRWCRLVCHLLVKPAIQLLFPVSMRELQI